MEGSEARGVADGLWGRRRLGLRPLWRHAAVRTACEGNEGALLGQLQLSDG